MYKQNKCTNKIKVNTKYMYNQSKCTNKINVQSK